LGDTDVARVGLGTNRLGTVGASVDFIRAAVAAGVNHIDTAHTYTGGRSEETIGAALSPIPDGLVVATKGGWADGRPETLRAQIEESLRRLRTESIPLYYLHRPDPKTQIGDSLTPIKEYWEAGKIRHVGLSNVGVDQIKRAREIVPIAAVQNHYSLSERRHDNVVDYCATEGIAFVPYYPLDDTEGDAISTIADQHAATRPQIALAWLLKRSPTILPIPGSLSLEHVKENLGAIEIELSEADYQALT
jgi:aryl-alcohol dehydrogenase-like predicted oxidoreductase